MLFFGKKYSYYVTFHACACVRYLLVVVVIIIAITILTMMIGY